MHLINWIIGLFKSRKPRQLKAVYVKGDDAHGWLKVWEEPNYLLYIRSSAGAEKIPCNTEQEVWREIGKRPLGALYEVDSPKGLDVSEFVPF